MHTTIIHVQVHIAMVLDQTIEQLPREVPWGTPQPHHKYNKQVLCVYHVIIILQVHVHIQNYNQRLLPWGLNVNYTRGKS